MKACASMTVMQVLSVPNPNVPSTVGMFPVEVHRLHVEVAALDVLRRSACILGALRVGPGWELITHLGGLLQDSTFVQDLVSLIKKRAPMQTYR